MASAAQNGCKLVLFSIVTEYFYLTFAFYLFALLITIIYIPVEKYFLKYSIPLEIFHLFNIVELLEPHLRRPDFPSHPKQFELALSFERPETIRAIRFFRAARNDSDYPNFSSRSKQIRATRIFRAVRILRVPGSACSVEPSQARLALFEYPNSSKLNSLWRERINIEVTVK